MGRIQVLSHHRGVLVGEQKVGGSLLQKVGGSLLQRKMLLTMWKFLMSWQKLMSAVVSNPLKERVTIGI